MSRLLIASVLTTLLASCASPIDSPRCTANSDCAEGYRCDAEGRCREGGELSVIAPALPPAYVGEGYNQLLAVQGGLPPYAWALAQADPLLDWLTVEPATGELRCKVGQVPLAEGDDLPFTVTVTDASQAGAGDQAGAALTLDVLGCRGDAFCYEPDGPACREGVRTCTDGHLDPTCSLSGFSMTVAHCGPLCEACAPVVTSACYQGTCACGTSPPCLGGESCCEGVCADLSTSTGNCGSCGRNCAEETLGVQAAFCAGGLCDYDVCAPGFLDCDGDRQNGCETPRGMQDCGACGDVCNDTTVYLHTEGWNCDGTACQYACAPGFDSCDLDPANGCEAPLDSPDRCGACDRSCAADPAGHACLPGVNPGEYACGCATEADCAPDMLCCGNLCVAHDATHCADCQTACTIGTGGLECLNGSGAWQCECTSIDDCKGIYTWSQADCALGITNQCACGSAATRCSGTTADMCCYVGVDKACVSLYEDESNCGRCAVSCPAGETCVNGSCTCVGGVCPANAGAPNCVDGSCVCFSYEGNACPAGQHCCPVKGCCLSDCASAAEADCSDACLLTDRQWCESGCCDSCNPDTNCT